MFGESDSESPRAPSPWDSLTSAQASSSPSHDGRQAIPKLVPEAEEGNIEYKLQLLSPTPARFARLVTQLKWRLLEGGGQAYYELGVSDSGTLVGLPRQQLEQSLETLEMMAGEIGASVIVVKEIEVPPEISSIAESQLERWDGNRSTRRKDRLRMLKHDDESPTITASELETEFSTLSTTDVTDAEESYLPVTPPTSVQVAFEPTGSKSPLTPSTFDSALSIFTMEIGDDIADHADNEAQDDDVLTHCVPEISSLAISSVYKPRPVRKRTTHVTHTDYAKKRLRKNGYPPSKSKSTNTTTQTAHSTTQGGSETLQPSESKSGIHRDRRDKRREVRLDGLLTHVPTRRSTEALTDSVDQQTPPCPADEPKSSVADSPPTTVIDPQTVDAPGETTIAPKEPRLIVEVLVVRKLSLDEAFLDFEGFSLQ